MIARGYSNAEIAEAFVVSEGTVKTHVKRVLAKLSLRARTQAAIFAHKHGVVGQHIAKAKALARPHGMMKSRQAKGNTALTTPRRLYRSRDHRMTAGVAGGMAERFNIPVSLARLLWLLLLLPGGLPGLLPYVICWFVIPQEE